MHRLALVFVVCMVLCGHPFAVALNNLLTQDYNNNRTGSLLTETIFTPADVQQFGLAQEWTKTLDSNVVGQPLYVESITIGGTTRSAVYLWTNNNGNGSPSSAYCFDAETGEQLWNTGFNITRQFSTATPVIDLPNEIIYITTKDNTDFGPNWIHALDITVLLPFIQSPPFPFVLTFHCTSHACRRVRNCLAALKSWM